MVVGCAHGWHGADGSSSGSNGHGSGQKDNNSNNGFSVVAQALARLGIKHMYGVVGIPVTELASAAQVCFHYPSSSHPVL